MDETAGYCYLCERRVALHRKGVNHILHLLLSIVTVGIWILFWILASIGRAPWRCSICGSTDVQRGERAAIDAANRHSGYGNSQIYNGVVDHELARKMERLRTAKITVGVIVGLLVLVVVLSHA